MKKSQFFHNVRCRMRSASSLSVVAVVLLSALSGAYAMEAIEMYAAPVEISGEDSPVRPIDENEYKKAQKARKKEMKRRKAEMKKRKAEMMKRKAEMEKRKMEVKKQKAEVNKHKAEVNKHKAKIKKQKAKVKKHKAKVKSREKELAAEVGEMRAIDVSLPAFNSLQAFAGIEIEFHQGAYPGMVTVMTNSTDDNVVSLEVNGGVLTAKYVPVENQPAVRAVISVTAPELKNVDISGGSRMTVKGPLSISDTMNLSAYSAASISMGEVHGECLNISAYSASEVYALYVDVGNVNVMAASAANVRLKGMNVVNVAAQSSSAAEVTLSGRCNNVAIQEFTQGEVRNKGLIVEAAALPRDAERVNVSAPRSL